MNYRTIKSWPAEQEESAKQELHDVLPPTTSFLRELNSPSTIRAYTSHVFECDQINAQLVGADKEPVWEPDPDKRL